MTKTRKRIVPIMMFVGLGACLGAGVLLPSCGDSKDACTLGDTGSCPPDKVCEAIKSAAGKVTPKCVIPTNLSGRVRDAKSDGPLGGARVVLWDVDTLTAVNAAVQSASGGSYLVSDMLDRKEGTVPRRSYNVRVSAPGYLDYPGGVRTSEKVTLMLGQVDADGQQLHRDFSLQSIPMAATGRIEGTISGGPTGAAALVVAESGGKGYSSVADATGRFVIFNVPDGTYEVRGYLKDWNWGPESVTVSGGAGANPALTGAMASGSVTGKASIAQDANPCEQTVSVSVAVQSTGELIPGVRGVLNATSGFEIKGVPAGNLLVQVSQENDCLVRDPGMPQFAAGISHAFSPGEAFDATTQVVPLVEALQLKHPGSGFEEQFGVDTLRWGHVAGADSYLIEVFDVFGAPLAGGSFTVSADMVTEANGGTLSVDTVLMGGLHYQWRATAKKADGTVITRTEERRGQFFRDRS